MDSWKRLKLCEFIRFEKVGTVSALFLTESHFMFTNLKRNEPWVSLHVLQIS